MNTDVAPFIPSGESHELKKDNDLEFPREYFEAQVAFAIKWALLTGEDIKDTLEQKTALARRVGAGSWQQGVATIDNNISVEGLTDTLYGLYSQNPKSAIQPNDEPDDETFGSEYYAGTRTIKVHFRGSPRGSQNILADDKLDTRRSSAIRAVAKAYKEHPEATSVVGGSWLYNLQSYRDSFPPAFTQHLKRLVPKELTTATPNAIEGMSFKGNSLWGQFVNRHGWAREDRHEEFMEAVADAQTTDELIEAFPLKPLYAATTPHEFLAL